MINQQQTYIYIYIHMYIPKNVHIKRQSSKIGQHSIKIYYFFTDENKCMYIYMYIEVKYH